MYAVMKARIHQNVTQSFLELFYVCEMTKESYSLLLAQSLRQQIFSQIDAQFDCFAV